MPPKTIKGSALVSVMMQISFLHILTLRVFMKTFSQLIKTTEIKTMRMRWKVVFISLLRRLSRHYRHRQFKDFPDICSRQDLRGARDENTKTWVRMKPLREILADARVIEQLNEIKLGVNSFCTFKHHRQSSGSCKGKRWSIKLQVFHFAPQTIRTIDLCSSTPVSYKKLLNYGRKSVSLSSVKFQADVCD